jgi:hypothetical protein
MSPFPTALPSFQTFVVKVLLFAHEAPSHLALGSFGNLHGVPAVSQRKAEKGLLSGQQRNRVLRLS